ncbi:MAG: hypothetical protein KKC85_16530, partial [Gammaproteobacteria bacterium]|nr:hypothetical protein [Gammaproteobacteria bacterium]
MGVRNGAAGADNAYRLADGRDYSYAELIGAFAGTVIAATGADGHRVVSGGKGDDAIVESSGHATLSGGKGDDTLTGSGGHNTYLYGRGDGSDTIVESRTLNDASGTPAPNRLRFGAGIAASDVRVAMVDGRLVLQVGADPADSITIVASDSNAAGG